MTAAEYTEKKLAELRKKQSQDVVIKKRNEASNEDKALTTQFYKALASRKLSDLEAVNEIIVKSYKQKAQVEGTPGTGTSGGLLVPTTVADSIVSKMLYISPIRQIAQVITNMPAQLQLPSESTFAQGYWVAEGAAPTESAEIFDPNMLTPWKAGALDSFTSEVIMDAATNPSIQNYVESRFAIALALLENSAFTNGTGSNMPWGFRSSAITPNSVAVAGDNTQYTDVINLKYSLKTAYRSGAVYATSSAGVQSLENVKDGYGRPIWRDGLVDGTPPTLLGRPIYLIDEIPSNLGVSGVATELWFGEFKNYFIGDRGGLRVDYGTNGTDFANDKISLRMLKRVAGRPVISESFSKLTGVQ